MSVPENQQLAGGGSHQSLSTRKGKQAVQVTLRLSLPIQRWLVLEHDVEMAIFGVGSLTRLEYYTP